MSLTSNKPKCPKQSMTSFQPFVALFVNEIHSVKKLSISDINDAVAAMLKSLGAAISIYRHSLLRLAITLTPKPCLQLLEGPHRTLIGLNHCGSTTSA